MEMFRFIAVVCSLMVAVNGCAWFYEEPCNVAKTAVTAAKTDIAGHSAMVSFSCT